MSCAFIIHFKEGRRGEGNEQADLTGVFALHPQTWTWATSRACTAAQRSARRHSHHPSRTTRLPATSQKQYTPETPSQRRMLGARSAFHTCALKRWSVDQPNDPVGRYSPRVDAVTRTAHEPHFTVPRCTSLKSRTESSRAMPACAVGAGRRCEGLRERWGWLGECKALFNV